MRALAIVHQANAGPGVFADALVERGWELARWSIASDAEPPEDPLGYDAVLSLGGAVHADQEDRHRWLAGEKALLARLLEARVPVLGVCLGAQLLAEAGGGAARRASRPEIGWCEVQVSEAAADDPLLAFLAPRVTAFQWHSYECSLPPGALALAHSPVCLEAYRLGRCAWGIQFHAEVTRVDAARWIEDYGSDPDAVAVGLDRSALEAQTEQEMGDWNEVGRGICRRFLDLAARL